MSHVQSSAWKPPRPKPEILPATVEQATEFMAWFVNRRAYTRQADRPDEKSGKYFFYQARDRQTKEKLALDKQIVRQHLAGEQTIGLYAINPETQRSKWVAIDADYCGAYRDLRTLKWELEQDGVHATVEMSRRGAHLWILCEEPLPAKLCRVYIYNLALRLDVPIKGAFKQVDGIEVFPRQDEIGITEFGNAIRAPLGIHRANMHRYWFEDAPSNLQEQLDYLRSVKRLTATELEVFTGGLSIPESVAGRPAINQPIFDSNRPGFQILQHVKVRAKRSGNYWAQCPSCAQRGRDRSMDNLAISVADSRYYKCWAGCTREMIREALGQPISQRTYRQ
jgi:hypothetical protein